MLLSSDQRQLIISRYQGLYPVDELGYGTVRDYCDSCDHLPFLSHFQGDLKDFERPWTVKAILGVCPPGSSLLEIGGGEPLVAQILSELGYDVTVVDPYDGSGGGPTEYEEFRRIYTGVKMHRAHFSPDLAALKGKSFDCIYSISVLEHIPEPALSVIFNGMSTFLKRAGNSLHSIDHVAAGQDAEFHRRNLADILEHQSKLRGGGATHAKGQVDDLEYRLKQDLDTYYLAASGHNLWRGGRPYDEFPFRHVVAILTSSEANVGAVALG